NTMLEKDLTVNGTSNLKDTNVEGDLSVTGNQIVGGDLVVNGKTSIKGDLDMAGHRIKNVGRAIKDTDAVNLGQVKEIVSKVDKRLRAGIAGANAAAGLPQVYVPGRAMVAASIGTFKGQSAIAVGYSRASDNGKLILKLQGNANSRGDFGGSVGVGYQW
ncbi:YadA-like family protein, partial [Ursidibacter arcticus]